MKISYKTKKSKRYRKKEKKYMFILPWAFVPLGRHTQITLHRVDNLELAMQYDAIFMVNVYDTSSSVNV